MKKYAIVFVKVLFAITGMLLAMFLAIMLLYGIVYLANNGHKVLAGISLIISISAVIALVIYREQENDDKWPI